MLLLEQQQWKKVNLSQYIVDFSTMIYKYKECRRNTRAIFTQFSYDDSIMSKRTVLGLTLH
jgi:hypothetical protein